MTFPAWIFGTLIALLLGALFHLWRGGGLTHLFLFCLLSTVGFWLGHAIAGGLGWQFATLGPLNLGLAVPTSLALIAVGSWLSNVNPGVADRQ